MMNKLATTIFKKENFDLKITGAAIYNNLINLVFNRTLGLI